MTFILMIARKGRMDAWHGRQIRRRGRDGLDPRLFVIGDDRHRLARFLRLGCGLLQDLDLAIDTQDLRCTGPRYPTRVAVGTASSSIANRLPQTSPPAL